MSSAPHGSLVVCGLLWEEDFTTAAYRSFSAAGEALGLVNTFAQTHASSISKENPWE
jgi:hypothetical protein